jgi:hypothetical protein
MKAHKSHSHRKPLAHPPRAELVHQSAGRTRIRVPSRRKDTAYFEKLREAMQKLSRVKEVQVNAATGSTLILHEREMEDLHDYGLESGLFELRPSDSNDLSVGQKVRAGMERVDGELLQASRGSFDLRSLAFLGLVGVAVGKIFQGDIFPPASTLLADAFRVLPGMPKPLKS